MSSGPTTNHQVEEDLLKPLWIATQIANRPCCVYWVMFVLMIILSAIDSAVFTLDLEGTERTWLVESDDYSVNFDAWTLALEDNDVDDDDGNDTRVYPQTEEAGLWNAFMMFQLKNYGGDNDWILTPDNIDTIVEYEEKITQDPTWKKYYCFVSDTDTYDCDYFSLAQEVYKHFNSSDTTAEYTTENVKNWIWTQRQFPWMQVLIDSSFNPSYPDDNKTKYYRGFLYAGGPIPNNFSNYTDGNFTIIEKGSEYEDLEDDYDKQEDEFNDDFAFSIWEEITVKHEAQLTKSGLRIVLLIYSAWVDYIWEEFYASATFIVLAMLSVVTWMTFHLQSCFLSCLGLCGILFSFPFAYFFYYYIYGITHFDFLSAMIIFVLLGVGADDVFVFTDAWHQSIHFVKDKDSDVERMTFAYRRASKAMFVTQITTFFAFLSTAASSLLPIAAFGYWASLIIAADFVLVITMYPSVLMMHHKYFKECESKYFCCCCYNGCKGCSKPEESSDSNTKKPKTHVVGDSQGIELPNATPLPKNEGNGNNSGATDTGASGQPGATTGGGGDNDTDVDADDEVIPQLARARSVEEQAPEYRAIEQFCGLKWPAIIFKIRYYVLGVFAVISAISLWLMITGIEPLEESEGIFTEDHYMQQVLDMANEFEAAEEDGLDSIIVTWGLKGVNRKGTNYWDVEDFGKLQYDNDFDMSSSTAQQFMYDTCQDLAGSDLVYSRPSCECPLDAVYNYTIALNNSNISFPYLYMDEDNDDYDADTQKAKFAEFMYEFSQSDYDKPDLFDTLVYIQTPDERSDGNYYIKYFSIFSFVDLTFAASTTDQKEVRDDWEDWLKDTFTKNSACPDSVCNPLPVSSTWTWLVSQEALVTSAIQGVAISLPIAYVVLILSTRNWIVATFAVLDILGVMSCGLAVISIAGWQFGTTESVSIVLIIGFSVDYVVHLANAYLECQAEGRQERLSFSLLTMGVSVGSGAITTLLAGIFLLFPKFLFFYKMGIMLVFTIIWSIIWAMFFFTSILAAFGPEGETGHIPLEKLYDNFKCKKDEEEQYHD